jgi:hypothetical protein
MVVVKRKRLPRKIHRSNTRSLSSVDNVACFIKEIITIFLNNLEETISIAVITGIDRNFELELETRQRADMLRIRERELDDRFVIDSQHMIAEDEDDIADEEDEEDADYSAIREVQRTTQLRTSAVREERIAKAMDLVQQCEKIWANKKKSKKKTPTKRQPRLKTTMVTQSQSSNLIPSGEIATKKKDPPIKRKKKRPLGKSELTQT